MNLIDNNKEMQIIKKIADEICQQSDEKKKEDDSYFLKRSEKNARVLRSIEEYDYHNPVEFQKKLCEMWKELDDETMQKFVTVCGVALYKNKKQKVENGNLSTFVYEF